MIAWRLPAFDRSHAAFLAAWACCLLLGLVALWLLVRLAWALWPRGDVALDASPPRVVAAPTGSAGSSVSRWHLFGSTERPPRVAAGAPATALSLVLRGTLAERDPRAGIAVIADERGVERAWRVGESLAAGVRLAEVHPDHVVLEHDGVAEVLRLPRDAAGIATAASPPARGAGASAGAAAGGPSAYSPPEMAHGAVDWQRSIEALRAQDATGLAGDLQVLPVFADGRLRGVRLSAAADTALVERLGLRPSDVVTAINGVPLDDPGRSRQVVENLRHAAGADLTVLRDGRPTEIHVTFR